MSILRDMNHENSTLSFNVSDIFIGAMTEYKWPWNVHFLSDCFQILTQHVKKRWYDVCQFLERFVLNWLRYSIPKLGTFFLDHPIYAIVGWCFFFTVIRDFVTHLTDPFKPGAYTQHGGDIFISGDQKKTSPTLVYYISVNSTQIVLKIGTNHANAL